MKMSKKEVRLKLEDNYCRTPKHKIWILSEDRMKIKGQTVIRVVHKVRAPAHPSIRSSKWYFVIRHTLILDGGLHNTILSSWWK